MKAAYDAIAAQLGASWRSQDGTVLTVQSLNAVGETPTDGSPFIVIDYPRSAQRLITIGPSGSERDLVRDEGAFHLVVNEERGVAAGRALGWADELRAVYRGRSFALNGEVAGLLECFGASPAVIDQSNARGNFYQLRMRVDYRVTYAAYSPSLRFNRARNSQYVPGMT